MFRGCAATTHGAVHCIRVGYLSRINTAVYLYRIGRVLIDTGPPNAWDSVRAVLESCPRPTDVFITHHHEDHAGNAGRIASSYAASLHASASTAAILSRPQSIEYYRALVWGSAVPACSPTAFRDEFRCPEGNAVIPIPAAGHSSDHIAYRMPQIGAVFCGDMYVTARPHVARFDEGVLESIASLERVASEMDESDTLFCAHRGPLPHGQRLLLDKAAWLRGLRERAEELYVGRGLPLTAVSSQVLGSQPEGLIRLATRGDFSRLNLVRGLLEPLLRPEDAAAGGHRGEERRAHWGESSDGSGSPTRT
jgi:glyoxylase-like metal-dependent hydrolase (beta-lactamase superfamily II)